MDAFSVLHFGCTIYEFKCVLNVDPLITQYRKRNSRNSMQRIPFEIDDTSLTSFNINALCRYVFVIQNAALSGAAVLKI